MKTSHFALGIALLFATSAAAQSTIAAGEPSGSGSHACLMSTDAAAWASLGLTAEQTKKVQDIQASYKKEYDAAVKEKKTVDPAAADRHDAQIKGVLTADQYTKWQAWCKEHPAKVEKKY